MPCIIYGNIEIGSLCGGVVNFGDSLYISPISVSDSESDEAPVAPANIGQAVTDPNIT
ncbi:spore germination protein [Halobacillus sp. ACCC02827]|uniref:spore germination protein n=1 Tax=Bacillaceae TaxID=186817 RepID=UPI0002A4D939|nr:MULTISPECIES: spore germination protein [Bacillaceae]ELK48510.1 hypothetical protein D479_02802 [Halobacillus sp. BAB-2008]QHT47892.1 spore germination protein [Bacillus sp. SB49]WJE15125.1 spore germination protein [Halobacillus sp. ACCC02827]